MDTFDTEERKYIFTYSEVMQDIQQCAKICKPLRQKEKEKQMIWNHNTINHTSSRKEAVFFLKLLSFSNYISYIIKVTESIVEIRVDTF